MTLRTGLGTMTKVMMQRDRTRDDILPFIDSLAKTQR